MMDEIYNPVNQQFVKINSKEGQKCVICYQLANQWKEETETPFDHIMDENNNKYSIHEKIGKELLKSKELQLMGGGSVTSKLIKKAIEKSDFESLQTESIMKSLSLQTESIVDSN